MHMDNAYLIRLIKKYGHNVSQKQRCFCHAKVQHIYFVKIITKIISDG